MEIKKVFEVTSTQQVPFQPGGTIHFNHSYGYLSVEGWDRPEVEITVIKSLDNLYDAKGQGEATKRVNTVQVTWPNASRTPISKSPPWCRITAAGPIRWAAPAVWMAVEYQVHVPRDSKLVIQHGTGDVLVSSVANDIEADVHSGDIVVLLPERRCSTRYRRQEQGGHGIFRCRWRFPPRPPGGHSLRACGDGAVAQANPAGGCGRHHDQEFGVASAANGRSIALFGVDVVLDALEYSGYSSKPHPDRWGRFARFFHTF